MTYHQPKGRVIWSRDCFKILPFVVMQRVARVSQRRSVATVATSLPLVTIIPDTTRMRT